MSKLKIEPKVISDRIFYDDRGVFVPTDINDHGFQVNISVNKKALTFRGMHLQRGDMSQSKKLKVIQGMIVDFCYRLIPDEWYGEYTSYLMKPGDEIIVPKGYAHGFLTLQPNTIVQYLVDEEYDADADVSINFQSFPGIVKEMEVFLEELDIDDITISDKDLNAPMLRTFEKDNDDPFGYEIYDFNKLINQVKDDISKA